MLCIKSASTIYIYINLYVVPLYKFVLRKKCPSHITTFYSHRHNIFVFFLSKSLYSLHSTHIKTLFLCFPLKRARFVRSNAKQSQTSNTIISSVYSESVHRIPTNRAVAFESFIRIIIAVSFTPGLCC